MRIFYALLLLLIFATHGLNAQTLNFSPAEGNPILKNHYHVEERERAATIERLTGINPLFDQPETHHHNDCPPDFEGELLEEGDSIKINLTSDTLFQNGGNIGDILTLLNSQDLEYGTARLDSIMLTYITDNPVNGAGTDKLCIEFCRANGECDNIFYEVTVKRKGRTVVAQTQFAETEKMYEFCLNNELDFDGKRRCSEFLDCEDSYDGEGQQLISFSSYLYPDTCIFYYANRFPGVDTVCWVMCDEFVVCDTFKMPIIVRGDTLGLNDLPIFDDFSYTAPYPTNQYWLDKQAYINTTLAPNPPSVGLATFDGLSHKGDPYEFINGIGDRLTSKAIDLSGLTVDDGVVLKFYVAIKGAGFPPSPNDTFTVEFRDKNRKWIQMDTYSGFAQEPALDSFPPFEFHSYLVDDEDFFHEAFQFRFSANTSPGGVVDLWHLDYVYFDRDQNFGPIFQDLAMTQLPTSPLKNHTSIPWNQFLPILENELNDTYDSYFFNHFNSNISLSENSLKFRETLSGTDLNFAASVPFVPNPEDAFAPQAFDQRQQILPSTDEFNTLKNNVQNLNQLNQERYHLQVEYAMTPNEGAIGITARNDTVRSTTIFDNYFAYDDGSSEWKVSLDNDAVGGQIAVRYHANVADTLRAIRMMFPHVQAETESQVFNLRVWIGSLDSEPVYDKQLLQPYFPNNLFDTIQGFTTYRLEDIQGIPTPVGIPADTDFYVGWQQISQTAQGVPVGFDINNDCGDCNFVNLSGNWNLFPADRQKAVMIRPVVGSTAPKNTTSEVIDQVKNFETALQIYPNPVSDQLFIRLLDDSYYEDYELLIFNNVGQLIQSSVLQQSLNLQSLATGMYFIKITNTKTDQVFNHKIVKL